MQSPIGSWRTEEHIGIPKRNWTPERIKRLRI